MRLAVRASEVAPLWRLAVDAGCVVDDGKEDAVRGDMPLDEYFQLVQQVSVKLRDESCRFSKRPLAAGATDFVMDTLVTAESLEEAMRHAARAYNLMHGGHYNRVERRRDRIAYVIDDRDFPYVFDADSDVVHALMEGVLIFLHALLSLAAGTDISDSLRTVRTRRRARQPSNGLLAFWTVPVRYGSPTYVLEYALPMASFPVRGDAAVTVRAADIYDNAVAMIAAREHSLRPNGFPARVGTAIAGERRPSPRSRRSSASAPRRCAADSPTAISRSARFVRACSTRRHARFLPSAGRSPTSPTHWDLPIPEASRARSRRGRVSHLPRSSPRSNKIPGRKSQSLERICPARLIRPVVDSSRSATLLFRDWPER
ncbi:hypothetical protein PIB19_12430 [Sphingomonas sp. 7/4-4]|nr:AraC family transcriptional regulator ligand-binding domain-containing protein [Sphingomonas sp. 7/4-4]WBY06407.1 hypothetical protein PIB19_12430 [Sphingomonas sp. 7/4-4]